MNNDLIYKLSKVLDDNYIPYMEISKSENLNIDATIKVYFPKIMANVCKFLDTKFVIENKDLILIKKDEDGYSFVELFLRIDGELKEIRLNSILKYTWGIADHFKQKV